MRSILSIFFRSAGANPWLVLLALMLASFAEGIGLASLLPLVSVLAETEYEDPSGIDKAISDILSFVGLPRDIGSLIGLLVAAMVTRALLMLFAMRYVGNATAEVMMHVRSELIHNLLRGRWAYFIQQPVGRIANATSVQAGMAAQAYRVSATFIVNTIRTLMYVGLAMFVAWKLAVIGLVIGVGIGASLHFLVQMAKRAAHKQTRYTSELVTYLSDTLHNIKPIKSMAKEGKFIQLFEKKISSIRKAMRRLVLSQEVLKYGQNILVTVALGGAFYFAVQVWNVPIEEVVLIGVLFVRTISETGKIQQQYQAVLSLEPSYLAVRGLIDEAAEAREKSHSGRTPTLEQSCRFDHVGFSFGETKVLKNVDLVIPKGALTVITGLSGAGKTTLTDLLLGLYSPTEGSILLDGVPLSHIDLRAWRGMIGYVPQELMLFHDSIFANVTLGDPKITETDVRAALKTAGAWEFVSRLDEGIMSFVGERGVKLSGGQRQRIALARALAPKPKLMILDEVTSAVDPKTEADICANLQALHGEVTALAITHRPAFLDIADQIYELHDGMVRAVEPATVIHMWPQEDVRSTHT